MSDTDNPVQEADTIEMPIDIVGDKVKSGRNVLADYDPATGTVEVRTKWKAYTDAIMAVVDEVEEGKNAEKYRGEGVPVDESALDHAKATVEKLDKEAEELATTDDVDAFGGIDMTKLDPNVAAMLMMQQKQLEMLSQKLNATEEDKVRTRDMGVVEEAKIEAREYAARLADDIEFAKANDVPMPPKKNPQFGDKTPAYVNWLKQYRPQLYESRYDISDYDRQITLRHRDGTPVKTTADIARRKVHTTHKPDMDPSLSPDMDWNA